MTEQELTILARKGDQEAFAQLVRDNERRVYTLALRMCGSPEDALDLAQETFLRAWSALPNFRGGSSFSTWLYRLASNACVDLLRREGRHRAAAGPSLDDEELRLETADPAPTPQEAAERAELRRQIENGLRALPAEYRQVLILREMHQLSYEEIGQTLSLDPGTVKSRISRGRKRLQKFLMESGNFSGRPPSKEPGEEGCQ